MMFGMRRLTLAVLIICTAASAQSNSNFSKTKLAPPTLLVVWSAQGGVQLPTGGDWKYERINAYDHANRIVVLYENKKLKVNASLIVFPNLTRKPTSEGCQGDIIPVLLKQFRNSISQHTDGTAMGANGVSYPATSYLLAMPENKGYLRNMFVFAGDAKLCTEIHVSTVVEGDDGESALRKAITEFHPELGRNTTAEDLFSVGSMLLGSPDDASPFFGEALARIPITPAMLNNRRVVTDQLLTTLNESKRFDLGRRYATKAIKSDPDYPLNYYNLACLDAEKDNATSARDNLDKAFARKGNILPGEHMPDPALDDSILKLRNNKEFWLFVEALTKN
jgi:tetratricopeptide (TPR) repeat protein